MRIPDPSLAQEPDEEIEERVIHARRGRSVACCLIAVLGTTADSYVMLQVTYLRLFYLISFATALIYLLSVFYLLLFHFVTTLIPAYVTMFFLFISSLFNLSLLLIDRRPINILSTSLMTSWAEPVPLNWWTGVLRFASGMAGFYLVLLVHRQMRMATWQQEDKESKVIHETEAYARIGRYKDVANQRVSVTPLKKLGVFNPSKFAEDMVLIEEQRTIREWMKYPPVRYQYDGPLVKKYPPKLKKSLRA